MFSLEKVTGSKITTVGIYDSSLKKISLVRTPSRKVKIKHSLISWYAAGLYHTAFYRPISLSCLEKMFLGVV